MGNQIVLPFGKKWYYKAFSTLQITAILNAILSQNIIMPY